MKISRILTAMFCFGAAAAASAAGNAVNPVWDFQKDPITIKQGNVELKDGKVFLDGKSMFAIPADAIKDQKNLTVMVTAVVPETMGEGQFTPINKDGAKEDSGFAMFMDYKESTPSWGKPINSVVNKVMLWAINRETKGNRLLPGTEIRFVIHMKDGFASFYANEILYKRCFMEVRENDSPIWIGKNYQAKQPGIPMIITKAQLYDGKLSYRGKREKKEAEPRGILAGKGWALDVPTVVHKEWPKVMFYGDSISSGYHDSFLKRLTAMQAYGYHFCHFVNGDTPVKILQEAASSQDFDVIVFNNGLHSLHWTEAKVSDEKVKERTRNIVKAFRAGAPNAKLFWLQTTPMTGKKEANGKVSSFGDLNPVVLRLNRLSAEVMKEEGVPVLDMYQLLENRLDLACGDGYHWYGPAYKMISDKIADAIEPAVKEAAKKKSAK